MTERCLTLGCPQVIRLSLVDPCTGVPDDGVANGYAVACPRNWSLEAINRDGDTSEFVSDCGFVVARDQQDDQHLGWTVSFEVASRSNELEALLTGKTLIASGGNNIGTYEIGGLGCNTTSPDPRLTLEVFYKLPVCIAGANYVRRVIGNVQFQVTEVDREGSLSFFRYTGRSSASLAAALGDGPFQDFPADVSAFLAGRDPFEYFIDFDFEETITITGSCGSIEVPAPGVGFFATVGFGTGTDEGGVDV